MVGIGKVSAVAVELQQRARWAWASALGQQRSSAALTQSADGRHGQAAWL